jgi:FemAB-related protein (PEP-CTERM system-associated)
MEITELRTKTAEWDAFVRASEEGTPFHLTAWRQVVEESFGHRPHYLMAKRAGAIEGVLPLFEVPRWLGGRSLISVPNGVYGGICAVTQDARLALLEAAEALGRRCHAAYLELRNCRDQGLALPSTELYATFCRAISPDEAQNFEAIPRKQRRMIKQGAKHGLRAEIGRDHLDECYAIYAHSVRNLGSPVFPRTLFQAILKAFDKECQILTVWHEGRVVAGVLTLFYQDRVLPYYGGALREAFQYAVNDFMYWELMRYASRGGYQIFDFGRSRVGTGSYHFKRHWGFEPRPLCYQYLLLRARALPNLNPSNRRLRWAIRAWRRLPLGLANRLGPWLTRYIPG